MIESDLELSFDTSLLPDIVFAGVVSLGGNCETAHWLRAHGRHRVRGPFDWLVTPLAALPNIIADDGARLGTTFALANAGKSVRCVAYGVLYHHEFPRAEQHAVRFDAESAAACRSKMAHKWARFVAACEQAIEDDAPILFLRLGGGTDLSWDRIGHGKAPLRATDLNAVAAALAKRFPRLDFRLLILLPDAREADGAFDAAEALDPRIMIRTLPRGVDPAWATAEADWGRLLTTLRFRDPPTATRLDETLHWSGEAEIVPAPPLQEAGLIVACLAMHKTGSVSITAALQDAGFPQALHRHTARPRTARLRGITGSADATAETASGNGSSLAARFAGSDAEAVLATCVRDPVGQAISAYFQFAASRRSEHGENLPLTREAVLRWSERAIPTDFQSAWFDENLRDVFGFDFRAHPFDHERRSIRFEGPRVRLLCLRLEDPVPGKEAELGWLVRRASVTLPRLNETADKAIHRRYADLLATFVAPRPWMDRLYGAAAIRHFYTDAEREAFRTRWSSPRP